MSGVISSVVTNSAAMVAVSSLNLINSQLNTVQNAVSTGYMVSSAADNGAAYAVAQSVRTNISGLTAANQQLGDTQGLLATTSGALTSISNMMKTMKANLVDLSNGAVTGSQRQQYIQQYKSNLQNIQTSIQDANYNGLTLIGNISGSNGTFTTTAISVVSNSSGGSFSIASTGMSTIYNKLSFTSTQLSSATSVSAFLTATGTFSAQVTSVGTAMNTYGNLTNLVNNQVTFNQNKMTALTNGLGEQRRSGALAGCLQHGRKWLRESDSPVRSQNRRYAARCCEWNDPARHVQPDAGGCSQPDGHSAVRRDTGHFSLQSGGRMRVAQHDQYDDLRFWPGGPGGTCRGVSCAARRADAAAALLRQ